EEGRRPRRCRRRWPLLRPQAPHRQGRVRPVGRGDQHAGPAL
ncbi:MAG: hypothetical protein AVDCRST_MAG41-3599, partial [uncultured Corynebacteriales bacterium]